MTATRATTESTVLRDIATAIETQRADDRVYHVPPIKRRAVELFASLNGWRWDPAFHFAPGGLGKAYNDYTHDSPSWFDHTLYFQGPRAGGKQGWVNIAIAAQPYELGDDDRAELAELQRQGYCIQIPPGGERESVGRQRLSDRMV